MYERKWNYITKVMVDGMHDMQQEIAQLLQSEQPVADLRSNALRVSRGFKSTWLLLAETLRDIQNTADYKTWGFDSFHHYCQDDLQLNRGMVKKLISGLEWVETEAPDFKPLPQYRQQDNLPRPLPDVETVNALARGLRDSEENRIPYERYCEIRDAALAGELTSSRVRQDLRDAVSDEIRDAEVDPVRHIKRALSEIEKALGKWSDTQPSDKNTLLAAKIRDDLFALVSSIEADD